MNVYDFDKTIYRGDSTVDFWRHCLRRYPGAARALPGTLAKALAFRQGNCSREQFKERFYQFLRFVPEAAQEAERFWDRHLIGIELWYRAQQSNTDVIISASPDFLIGAACRRLGVRRWTRVPDSCWDRTAGEKKKCGASGALTARRRWNGSIPTPVLTRLWLLWRRRHFSCVGDRFCLGFGKGKKRSGKHEEK